jgi:hypothetical protein
MVRNAGALAARMPCRSGRDRLAAAAAASEAFAGLGDGESLRQQIDIDVSGAARLMADDVQGDEDAACVARMATPVMMDMLRAEP